MTTESGIIVLAGYLVRYPLGGFAWQAAHYLSGLRALGFDVYFYEETEFYPPAYNPAKKEQTYEYDYGVKAAANFLASVGFGNKWVFVNSSNKTEYGPCSGQAQSLLRDADLLINLGGVNRIAAEKRCGKPSIYIDFDPAYTQLKLLNGDEMLKSLLYEHTALFSYGENIGTPHSTVPSDGHCWHPTRPPVTLEFWSHAGGPGKNYTTIGAWNSSDRDLVFNGSVLRWRKRTEWMRYVQLPQLTKAQFELAMDVDSVPGDVEILTQNGWIVQDPLLISTDPWNYRNYIATSYGEFTVAKQMNVKLRSGWFSDRSACYLASGRPVITQDTGFSSVIPVGEGLFAFNTAADILEAVEAINADYQGHCNAARALAEDYFKAEMVLAKLITDSSCNL
jgi:hypothetical protein